MSTPSRQLLETMLDDGRVTIIRLDAENKALNDTLRQRKEEVEKRMTAWNKLRDGYDESIAQLQAQLAAMNGPGTPYTRWQRIMEELERRFPDPQPYASSDPAEAHYLEAIDGLIAQLAAMTAERDEWQKKANWKHVHDDSLEIELQQQFAASHARCAELEKALNVMATCGCVDEKGVPFAACQECNGTGGRRSAPTDRPASMTNERAKEAARNILMTLPTSDSGNYCHDDLVQAIASDLAARERAAWLEASLYWDTIAEGPYKDGDDFVWACRVAAWCRKQAEAVKP